MCTLLLVGIADPWVSASILLSIAVTVVCAIYGIINWNRGDNSPATSEDREWVAEEDRIEEEL